MNDRGFSSTTGTPARRPSTTSELLLCALNFAPIRSASSSTTRNPALCRVNAYRDPGLPRPTTRNLSSATAELSAGRNYSELFGGGLGRLLLGGRGLGGRLG